MEVFEFILIVFKKYPAKLCLETPGHGCVRLWRFSNNPIGSKKYPAKILPGNSREARLVGSTI